MRIGIMGGTFNPIHFGHLVSAEEICDNFGLNRLLFVPSYIAPHKNIKEVAGSDDRLSMVKLAIADNERFGVSSCEIDRKGVSYSVDTVYELKKHFCGYDELFFVLGIDAFRDISSWKSPDKLLLSINFIVHSRAGHPLDDIVSALEKNITKKYNNLRFFHKGWDKTFKAEKIVLEGSESFIYTVAIRNIDISSTDIRKRVSDSRTIRYLMPAGVEQYILDKGIYR